MFTLYNAQIDSISLHRIGNKSRNEPLQLSKDRLQLDDEIGTLLKQYFFSPFTQKEVNYFKFAHEVDLEFNPVYQSVKSIWIFMERWRVILLQRHRYSHRHLPR